MAALTDNLPNSSSSARIINPGGPGPSFLEGLAGFAQSAVNGGARLFEQNRADRARAEAQAKKDREDAVQDQAFGEAFNYRTGQGVYAEAQEPLGAPIRLSQVNGTIRYSVDEVARAQNAERQGRAVPGSSRVLLEARISSLMNQYPDQRAEIFATFKDSGIDHYLFREADIARQFDESSVDQEIAQNEAYRKAAVEAGAVTPDMDEAAAIQTGRQLLADKYAFEQAKAAADAQRAAASEGREVSEWEQKQADRTMVSSALGMATAGLTPLMNQFLALSVEAGARGDSSSFDQLIPELQATFLTQQNNGRQVLIQAGATSEQLKDFDDQFALARQQLTDIISGPASEYATKGRTLKSIQDSIGLNALQALPVYSSLVRIYGQGAVNEMFPMGVPIDPTIKAQIEQEIKGLRGDFTQPEADVSMATIAQMLRGQLNIQNLSEEQAVRAIPQMAHAVRGNAASIAAGDFSAAQQYTNANLQFANAALELQPGMQGERYQQVVAVASTLFSPTNTNAQKALARNPGTQDEGRNVIAANRGVATHVLQLASQKPIGLTESNGGLWSVQWNDRSGIWETTITQQNYNRWAANQRGTGMAGSFSPGTGAPVSRAAAPSLQEMFRRGAPTELDRQTGARNQALNYLLSTSEFDEELRGVSAREQRLFFGKGIVPEALRGQEGGSADTFDERVASFRQDLANFRVDNVASSQPEPIPPTSQIQRTAVERGKALGLSEQLIMRTGQRESNWNPNARNSKTGAQGIFQMNDDVQRSLDENINDGLQALADAQDNAKKALGRQPQDWETYVAHQQGAGGGPALLNPSNANKNAVDVLAPLYSSRSIARQAVTNNGGNVNMTAAQFLQAIKNFYEG